MLIINMLLGHALYLVARDCSAFLLNPISNYFPGEGTVYSLCVCVLVCAHAYRGQSTSN